MADLQTRLTYIEEILRAQDYIIVRLKEAVEILSFEGNITTTTAQHLIGLLNDIKEQRSLIKEESTAIIEGV